MEEYIDVNHAVERYVNTDLRRPHFRRRGRPHSRPRYRPEHRRARF
jgi:hypothetical protein